MSTCAVQESGSIELLFYGELDEPARREVEVHVRGCAECAEALRELEVIRAALAERPDVSAPPSGDWTVFMDRLDAALLPRASTDVVVPFSRRPTVQRRPFVGLLATAALLAIVSLSVFVASRAGRTVIAPVQQQEPRAVSSDAADAAAVQAGMASVGLKHLERSKLVVLGLATREAGAPGESDWSYERELASALLNDTRLYRMAAEQRGLTSLAGVMKDLEIVLLQASMADGTDTSALPQIQRLIQKRGLVQKMDVVGTTGLLP